MASIRKSSKVQAIWPDNKSVVPIWSRGVKYKKIKENINIKKLGETF